MSYIEENSNVEDYFNSRANKRSRNTVKYTLSVFNRFCLAKYQRDSKTVVKDLRNEPSEKIYTMANQYVIWLGQDHPEILIKIGRHKYERPMKALHPATIRNYVGHLKDYLEEVGGFEISDRRWKRRIKLPKMISEDPEPFRPEPFRPEPSGQSHTTKRATKPLPGCSAGSDPLDGAAYLNGSICWIYARSI